MWELSHLTHFFRFLYFEAFLHLNTDLSHSPAWFSSKSFLLPLYLGIISSTLIWYQASVEILYIVLFQFLFSHTSDCLISCSDSSIMQLKLSCCQHQLPVIPYCLLLLLTLRHYHFLSEKERTFKFPDERRKWECEWSWPPSTASGACMRFAMSQSVMIPTTAQLTSSLSLHSMRMPVAHVSSY